MKKIKYKDITTDKDRLLCILDYMILIYKSHNKHTQVIECQQWVTMLNKCPIQTEYTPDALIALKNILNDAINYLACKGNIDLAEKYIILIDKVIKLFEENEKD